MRYINRFVLVFVATLGCRQREAAAPSAPLPAELCVVRHAQAFKNLDPLPASRTAAELDSLTPEGEAQASALRVELGGETSRVLSSPAGRAIQTARALTSAPLEVDPMLRPLDGALAWEERRAGWARGEDPRPPDGESLADGARRVEALLARLRSEVGTGERVVVVTHGDIASLLLGELRGTTLFDRVEGEALGTGEMRCAKLERRDERLP